MAIWTQGADFVVATGHGIARAGGAKGTVCHFPNAGLRRDQDPPELVSFVMQDDEGKRAIVQRRGEAPALWTHGADGGVLAPCDAEDVIALAASPGGPMVALARDGVGAAARLVLRQASLHGRRVVLGDEIPVPEAPRLAWNSAIMKDERVVWPEDSDDDPEDPPFDPRVVGRASGAAWRGVARLTATRHGVGVTSTYSGLAGVLDPRTLAFRVAARAPARREQFDLFALPLPAGMLVTLVANGRHTELVHVDASGAVGATRAEFDGELAWGATSPGLAWDGETVLVSHALSDDRTYSVGVPGLAAKRFGKGPGFLVDGASSADGSHHVLAMTSRGQSHPKSWKLARWAKKAKRWAATELEMPDWKPPAPAARAPAGPERMTGTPALGLLAEAATPWRARVGEEVALSVRLENRGGPTPGLYVELGGAAIGEGWLSGQGVASDGVTVPLVRKGGVMRAELPAVSLPAGFVVTPGRPKTDTPPPPPQPALVLTVRMRAERAGEGLLTVRVGPRGATGTAGSGMVGRSFSAIA